MSALVKSTNKLPSHVLQPVAATVLVPQNRAMTLVGRKAHIMMIAIAQKQAADGRKPTDGFVASLHEILTATGSAEATRPLLRSYLDQMMHTLVEYRPLDLESVVIELDATGDDVVVVQDPVIEEERIFPLMAEVRLIKRRGGDWWVQWFYPPTILEEIVKPTRWAQVNLDVVRSFRTYAACMLYLVCVRYQNNPGARTGRYPVKVLDLMLRSRPEKKHRAWRRLKTDVVKAAIAEVNELADIAISLVEMKMGREVTHVQFNVTKQPVKVARGPVDVKSLTLAERVGVEEHQMQALKDEFGAERVIDGMERVERYVLTNPGKRLGNPVEYLRATIKNSIAEGKAPATTVTPRNEEAKPAVSAWEAQEKERQVTQGRAFAAIEVEFRELPVREQIEWTHRYADSLAADHVWKRSKLTMARLAGGEWQSASIRRSVLGFYGQAMHGDDWLETFSKPALTPL